MPHKCWNSFFSPESIYSCSLRGFPMFCFVLFILKLSLYAPEHLAKLKTSTAFLNGEASGSSFFIWPQWVQRVHFACPGRMPNRNLQWHVKEWWAWMCAFGSVELTRASVRPAFLWLPPDSLKEMKRFIGSEEESGQERARGEWGSCRAQVPLWYLRTHGFFAGQVRYVLRSLILLSPHPHLSFLPSPLLGTIFVHSLWNLLPFISLFWEIWSHSANHHFGISNGAIVLVLCFWSFFWKV